MEGGGREYREERLGFKRGKRSPPKGREKDSESTERDQKRSARAKTPKVERTRRERKKTNDGRRNRIEKEKVR